MSQSSRQLSPHFSLNEATRSETAERMGIENIPEEAELARMTQVAERMERIRTRLGNHPIHVDSWFRCDALNEAVGGVPNSAHRMGWAVDFVCPDFGTPLAVALRIVSGRIAFDQLIYEYGRWVHISFAPQMRGQVLTAMSGGYRNGLLGE